MKIWVATTTFNGDLMLKEMLRRGINVSGVIGLNLTSSRVKGEELKSSLNLVQKHSLEYIELCEYGPLNENELATIASREIDVLLVCGWQRLIPQQLIDLVGVAVIGIHGSDQGITKGRGRSPQNWAILLGATDFSLSLFEITSGIDSGRVIDTTTFRLSKVDDIYTCHLKTAIYAVDMIESFLHNPKECLSRSVHQDHASEYLPQRVAEDGLIDWNQPLHFLERFVSALTKPYPGAFAYTGGDKLVIWRLRSIQEFTTKGGLQSAFLLHVVDQTNLIIQTPHGLCLIDEFDFSDSSKLFEGCEFQGTNFRSQIHNICERHRVKYPTQEIAARVKELGIGYL